eukprot:2379263-Rhodomonas_salina.5
MCGCEAAVCGGGAAGTGGDVPAWRRSVVIYGGSAAIYGSGADSAVAWQEAKGGGGRESVRTELFKEAGKEGEREGERVAVVGYLGGLEWVSLEAIVWHHPRAVSLRACYAVSGTDVAYGAAGLCAVRYGRSVWCYRPTRALCNVR